MTTTKTGLSGPYRLSFDAIGAAVTRTSAGVFALGHADAGGRFCVNHVGRSDSDIRTRLLDYIGSDALFKFDYFPTSRAAFERECELFLLAKKCRHHPLQSRRQTGRLVDPRRQDHDGVFVEDDLEFKTEIANHIQHCCFMRVPRGYDALPYRERIHTTAAQFLDKHRGWRVREGFAVLTLWPIQNCAIFRDDSVEHGMLRENLL